MRPGDPKTLGAVSVMLTVKYNPSVLHPSSKVCKTVVSTHFSICVPKWQFGEISIGFLSSTQHRKEVPRGNQTPSFKQHKRPLYLFRHKSSFNTTDSRILIDGLGSGTNHLVSFLSLGKKNPKKLSNKNMQLMVYHKVQL